MLEVHTTTWKQYWRGEDQELIDETEQIIKYIRKLLQNRGHHHSNCKDYTPEEIRWATKAFKANTAIGVDGWNFKDIGAMPQTVLTELGKILGQMKRSFCAPVRLYLNLMASLPKKTGGVRTVAILPTLYRLLMQLDNQRLDKFEKENAYRLDSAKAGASAVKAAEDRALEAELCQLQGKCGCTILWNVSKFFESINIKLLVEEAEQIGFPLEELALSLTMHQAPRCLRIGRAQWQLHRQARPGHLGGLQAIDSACESVYAQNGQGPGQKSFQNRSPSARG